MSERVRIKNVPFVPDGEYTLVHVDDEGRYVFRDDHHDTYVEQRDSRRAAIDYRCPECAGWHPSSWAVAGCQRQG